MGLKGYIFKEQIHSGIHSNVFRAQREHDNRPGYHNGRYFSPGPAQNCAQAV